jgi:hypothetical protein
VHPARLLEKLPYMRKRLWMIWALISKNLKIIIHQKCGRKHIDRGRFAHFNHVKHLCEYCNEFFYDMEPSIGIEPR